jgi:hypothetical protein
MTAAASTGPVRLDLSIIDQAPDCGLAVPVAGRAEPVDHLAESEPRRVVGHLRPLSHLSNLSSLAEMAPTRDTAISSAGNELSKLS